MVLPSRVLHLPMAFDERWTHEALAKYAKSTRPEAPYLPSNIQVRIVIILSLLAMFLKPWTSMRAPRAPRRPTCPSTSRCALV